MAAGHELIRDETVIHTATSQPLADCEQQQVLTNSTAGLYFDVPVPCDCPQFVPSFSSDRIQVTHLLHLSLRVGGTEVHLQLPVGLYDPLALPITEELSPVDRPASRPVLVALSSSIV